MEDYMTSGLWWKRLVYASWMMMMALVLVKSYAGNLMSALAVRHIEQPYQTLRDLLDDPSPTMIWPYNSKNVQYFKSVKSGIYQEVAEMESRGRIKYQAVNQFFHSIDILVRRGRCDFYMSRERLLPSILAPIGQKNRLLVPAISKMYSQ
ncbi:putative olfactory ionotropic receptor IR7-like 6, partial [Homarus americanus]